MKKYFIILTANGEIFSEEEFATAQMAAEWAAKQETDERLFIEEILEVI
jgi:hypothetical protein